VRVFFEDRGFGFIEQEDGGGESVFLHARELQEAGIPTPPATGMRLEFRVERTTKGLQARHVRLPGESDKERERDRPSRRSD
jgi:cold shock CspA family protein